MTKHQLPARGTSDFGSQQRLDKTPHAIVARDLTAGGMTLSIGVQILEPTVLDSYMRRRLLSARQHEAGCLLSKLFNRAIHLPSITASYGESRGGGGGVDTGVDARGILWGVLVDAKLALRLQREEPFGVQRRDSFERENVSGPVGLTDLGHLAVSVCGYDDRAGGTRAIKKLQRALDQLADLWAIPDADKPRNEGRIRRYRPGPKPPITENFGTGDLAWSENQNENRRRRRKKAKRESDVLQSR